MKKDSVFHRLYVGTGAFDVVGKRKRWYIFFASLMLVCIASIVFRGFNLGIDFKGGTRISMPAEGAGGKITTEQVTDVFTDDAAQGAGGRADGRHRRQRHDPDPVGDAEHRRGRRPQGRRCSRSCSRSAQDGAAERAGDQRQRGERVVGR